MTARDGRGEVRGEYVPSTMAVRPRAQSAAPSGASGLRLEGHSPTRARARGPGGAPEPHPSTLAPPRLKNAQEPRTGEHAMFNQLYGAREEYAAVKIQSHARGMQDRARVMEMRGVDHRASRVIVQATAPGTRDYGHAPPGHEEPVVHVQAKAVEKQPHVSTLDTGVAARGLPNAQTEPGYASLFNAMEGRAAAAAAATRIQAHERGRQARRHILDVQQTGVRPVVQPQHPPHAAAHAQAQAQEGVRSNYGPGGDAAATAIQAHARGMVARREVEAMRAQAGALGARIR